MNIKYNVHITYHPSHISGQQLVGSGGITYSIPSYSSEYYIASMPEAKLYASGSSYVDALNKLLATSSSAINPGDSPLSDIQTW